MALHRHSNANPPSSARNTSEVLPEASRTDKARRDIEASSEKTISLRSATIAAAQ